MLKICETIGNSCKCCFAFLASKKIVHMCAEGVLMWNMKHEGMKTKQHKMLESGETPAIVCFLVYNVYMSFPISSLGLSMQKNALFV